MISAKAIPHAVDRNKVRRRMRAIFARGISFIPAYEYVVKVTGRVRTLSYQQLQQELQTVLQRIPHS